MKTSMPRAAVPTTGVTIKPGRRHTGQAGGRSAQNLPISPLWAAGPVPLSSHETELVARMMVSGRSAGSGTVLATADTPALPSLLLSGWACRFRIMADGRRQILGVLLPGDEVNPVLQPPGSPSPYSVIAITAVQVAPAEELRQRLLALDSRFARLHAGCLASVHVDLGRSLDQAVRLGRQTAYERLSHFLLDLFQRLHAIGQVSGNSFRLPLTQEAIGDAVGLSYVHVNRTLQEMRRNRVIATQGSWFTLTQPRALARIAEFAAPALPGGADPSRIPAVTDWTKPRGRAVALPRQSHREIVRNALAS